MNKVTNWIHFIGKSYYTMDKFISEAKEKGISRAVSHEVFKKMNIGDRIFLAQKDGKSTKIFGYFVFESIVGQDSQFISGLKSDGYIVQVSKPDYSEQIERGCGEYTVTGVYAINSPDKLMERIRESDKEDVGRVMIGGKFHYLNGVQISEDYILSDIPFRQGFRLFDFDLFYFQYDKIKFDKAFSGRNQNRHIKIKGQFYANERIDNEITIEDPLLLRIENYKLN